MKDTLKKIFTNWRIVMMLIHTVFIFHVHFVHIVFFVLMLHLFKLHTFNSIACTLYSVLQLFFLNIIFTFYNSFFQKKHNSCIFYSRDFFQAAFNIARAARTMHSRYLKFYFFHFII